ncbi:hypothetical protein MCEGE14_03505 [Burkholderiaceae bacterium]
MKWRSLMWILWPSFLMAGLASAVVFALIDPLDVSIFGYIRPEREMLYAFGFFFFWLIAALSSVLTVFMSPKDNKDQNSSHF